ncbi:MAG: FIST C-terminal domain-containing protein [Chloroflexi bacterium]|nr:FIST C-terminal domain-containing protein [Chloroflexota bacterium]
MEGVPALSLMLLSLPGAELTPARFTQREVEALETAPEWRAEAGLSDERVNGWLLFADPFRIDSEALIGGLASAYPRKPIVGGLASGDHRAQRTHVFLDDQVFSEGAVGLAVGGAIAVKTVVSQGCAPIGEAWTITGVQGNVVETISGRSALEVLIETLRGLPPAQQRRAERNLLVGLAIDEYRDTFTRGDFLIRNLTGVDQESGAIGLNAYPRLGQTIQFQMRDAAAADDDINELLGVTTSELGNQKPVAAVLCSCNGRGAGLFGAPDHDAAAVAAQLGRLPVAGFFCNGEIGPIGDRIFLHGFTASIALLVPA